MLASALEISPKDILARQLPGQNPEPTQIDRSAARRVAAGFTFASPVRSGMEPTRQEILQRMVVQLDQLRDLVNLLLDDEKMSSR